MSGGLAAEVVSEGYLLLESRSLAIIFQHSKKVPTFFFLLCMGMKTRLFYVWHLWMVLSLSLPFQGSKWFKICFFYSMIRAYVIHHRCKRCKFRSSVSAVFLVWAFNISGRPLSGFAQKICRGFKDILQMKVSTKLVHKKSFLVKQSVFCQNSLEFNEVSKHLNRSVSFPCHFPAVISSIMSPRTVNDQRTEIKDERGLWFIYFNFYKL